VVSDVDDSEASAFGAFGAFVLAIAKGKITIASLYRTLLVIPLIKTLGFDPIWLGMITPPVGLNCFIVARYANRPVAEVFHGTFPHFIAHLIAIAILVAFPSIILWLPSHMGN
jgi:TRAP-type C4-dicarboxylate transport system permease large subunit